MMCVCPRAAAARHVVVAGRAGRSQQCAALSSDERQQRYETFLSSHRHRHQPPAHLYSAGGLQQIESSDFSVRGSVSSDGAAVSRPPHVSRAATHAWNSLVSEEWTQSPGKC